MNPKHQLEALIQQCMFELEIYAARPDAKDGYLQKQNVFLHKLVEIYNQLDSLHYYDIWVTVESVWRELEKNDANHAGIAVDLATKPNAILSRLRIKLYEHGV